MIQFKCVIFQKRNLFLHLRMHSTDIDRVGVNTLSGQRGVLIPHPYCIPYQEPHQPIRRKEFPFLCWCELIFVVQFGFHNRE